MGSTASVKKERPLVRLLLLGPGGVGKSTLFKQVKLHKANGFSAADLERGAAAIRGMLKTSLSALVRNEEVRGALGAAQENDHDDDDHARCADALLDLRDLDAAGDQQKLLAVVQRYWQTDKMRAALVRLGERGGSSLSALGNEWLQFWLDGAARVLAPGYVPTSEDMLKLRRPTSGVRELRFSMAVNGATTDFCLVDVGGQVHEMKTWDSELQKPINGIVFMASLADYRAAGTDVSRLMESFTLLDDILQQAPVLQTLPLVVMMNKVDLFKKLIRNGSNFRKYVRDCPKDVAAVTEHRSDNDKTAARIVAWLKDELTNKKTIVTSPHGTLSTFATCATDTTMAETMIDNLVEAIFLDVMEENGML